MTAARRLAATLAADVVGYSGLMGDDEAGTAARCGNIAKRRRRSFADSVAGSSRRWTTSVVGSVEQSWKCGKR